MTDREIRSVGDLTFVAEEFLFLAPTNVPMLLNGKPVQCFAEGVDFSAAATTTVLDGADSVLTWTTVGKAAVKSGVSIQSATVLRFTKPGNYRLRVNTTFDQAVAGPSGAFENGGVTVSGGLSQESTIVLPTGFSTAAFEFQFQKITTTNTDLTFTLKGQSAGTGYSLTANSINIDWVQDVLH